MPQTWRTIRVFISSTFRDMHAERDHLVRVVFPELKDRCRKRHIQLIDVDLRWGVTEEQAEGGGALDICLDEIDSCRPYFLGLMGHRYGYVPPGHDHSITAEEIYHGVLHNSLPRQLIDLRPFVEGILEGRTLFKEQVGCLLRCYQWDPEKRKYLLQQAITPEDRETLRSIFNAYSFYQRDRSFFFFRSESLTRKLAGAKIKDYFEADEALKGKLEALKQEIIGAALPYFEYDDLETFGQKVLETLWERIDAEFPADRKDIERDWLAEEAEFHELFMADRTLRFVGRLDILKTMQDFVEKESEPWLMVITGEPGCGKSALMSRFTEEVIRNHPDWLVLSHFVGASPSSTSLRRTLRRLCGQLNHALGIEAEVPEDYKELAQLFPELLQKASETRRIILAIDALNQFERADNAHSMRWLPQKVPENVRVVVSTLAGEALDALKAQRIQPRFEELSGLKEDEVRDFVTGYLEEIRKRRFPNDEIRDTFYNKIKAGNPLYILVALEELRVFPIYEEVGKRVARLPDTVPDLFDQVLERIEGDFNQSLVKEFISLIACGRQGMAAGELQTLLKGHAPVISSDHPPEKLPDMLFSRLRRAFSAYLFERSGVIDFFHGQIKEAVGKRYMKDEADRDKTHSIIANYFEKRWKEPYRRALDELPHQLTKSKDWEGLERILCDLHFIEAKCAAGMTYELTADYNAALEALPEAQEEKRKEMEHAARVKKYTEDLIAYARGEIAILDIIPSVRPWTDEEIEADSQRIVNNPTRLDRVRAFSQFVNSESHGLVKFRAMPGFCLQQAYNCADSGPVARMAESMAATEADAILLLLASHHRPRYSPHPALLRTLEGHTLWVKCVSITPDGKRAVSGSADNTLRLWDMETGQCLRTLEGHTGVVWCVSITPDGKRAVSGSLDKTLRVWDLESGECLRTLQEHTEGVYGVSIAPDRKEIVWDWDIFGLDDKASQALESIAAQYYSATFVNAKRQVTSVSVTQDGGRAISGDSDGDIRVWNLESGECLRTLQGHTGEITTIGITADGKRAVSGGKDGTLRIWNVESGKWLRTLKGHTDQINSVSLTPDGKRAISGGGHEYSSLSRLIGDYGLRVWDMESGECLRTFQGHTDRINSVSITPDGKRAVSGSRDDTLRVWDLDSGKCLRTFQAHSDVFYGVGVTPDGKRASSGGWDKVLRMWDMESGRCLGVPARHGLRPGKVDVTSDRKLAVSTNFEPTLQVWDIAGGEPHTTLEGHTDSVTDVSITPDGKRAVSGSKDDTLRVWDTKSGECLEILTGHTDWVYSVKVTPEGRRAISGSVDRTLRVWDLGSGRCLRTLQGQTDGFYSVCVTPDGKAAVSGRGAEALCMWDIETGRLRSMLKGHTDSIIDVSITPDGKRVVSGSKDHTLRVWDLRTGECIGTLQGHTDEVHSVCVTPEGRRVISGSVDRTLRVWDILSGKHIGAIYSEWSPLAEKLEIKAGGYFILRVGTDEMVFLTCRNLATGNPFVTSVRIWLYGQEPSRLFGKKMIKGRWDNHITTTCQWCGLRFPVSDKILDVIRAIKQDAHLPPDQSPCLGLPDEAWEEPRLLSECPLCHKPLKFNPFIVDNKGRY